MKQTKLPVINRSLKMAPVWYQNNWTEFPTSEHRSEYTCHNLSKSADFSPKLTYAISNIPFNELTEHRDNYMNYKRNNSNNFLRRRDQIQLSKLPMESISIYNNEYKSKNSVKSFQMKPHASQLDFVFNMKENNSTDSSLYKSDFRVWEKENNNKKVVTFKDSTIDNQGAPTDYQENFQKKIPTRIFLPYPTYKKPKIPFACDTSYNVTFVKHPYSKEAMIMPAKSNLTVEDLPFGGKSLYKSDFIEKERDNEVDDLNIYQNPSSFMQIVPMGNWYDKYPSQEFKDHSNHVFYQK